MVTRKAAERLIAELESKYNSDQTEMAGELAQIAETEYFARGDYPSAIALSRDAFSRARLNLQYPAIDNRATLAFRKAGGVLGAALTNAGEFDDALSVKKEVSDVTERAFGPSHEWAIKAQENIANTLMMAGRFGELADVLRDVLAREETNSCPADVSLLPRRASLANALRSSAQLEDALAIDRESLRIAEAAFGRRDPRTMQARIHVAGDYGFLEMVEDACAMINDLATDAESALDPTDPLRQQIMQMKSVTQVWFDQEGESASPTD